MATIGLRDDAEEAGGGPGWRALTLATACYVATIVLATLPVALHARTRLPHSRIDPLQHLTVMRWYKTCLLEGRSPLRCPDLQAPLGAPLGNFSPLHLQSLVYIPISFVIHNDVLCHNLLWYGAFVFTGVGSFLLCWQILRHGPVAWFGGMLVMLSTPMMFHACGHLELMCVGGFPLFMAAWMRFVDRPGRGRMVAAAASLVLLGMCAAYFLVFAVFPAALYVAWRAAAAGRSGSWAWTRPRLGWMAGMVVLALPCLMLLFANQLGAVLGGESLSRPRSEFNRYGAPIWAYLVPASFHRAFAAFPFEVFDSAGYPAVECASYLGIATLVLMHYAAVRRVGFRGVGYWWAITAVMVVLSFGAKWRLGTHKVDLPAGWIWDAFLPFRLIRIPARFNLFVAVCASLIAAAGLRHLLGRIAHRGARMAVFGALVLLAVADLSVDYNQPKTIPPMPAGYEAIRARSPKAALLDAPLLSSGEANSLVTLCGYWQAFHGLKTTAGYSGHANGPFDNRVVNDSPFHAVRLCDPNYLAAPGSQTFGLVAGVDARDYVWLYLTANHLDYVMLHHWAGANDLPVRLDRIKALLAGAMVYGDVAGVVYDRSLIPAPTHPVVVQIDGWRQVKVTNYWGPLAYAASKVSHLAAFNPDASADYVLELDAAAFREPRTVHLRDGATELASWTIRPGTFQSSASPAFRLPAGLRTLTLECDGDARPTREREQAVDGDKRPYSFKATRLALKAASAEGVAAACGTATRR